MATQTPRSGKGSIYAYETKAGTALPVRLPRLTRQTEQPQRAHEPQGGPARARARLLGKVHRGEVRSARLGKEVSITTA